MTAVTTVWSVVRKITQPLNKKLQKEQKKIDDKNFQTKKIVTTVGISLRLRNFVKKKIYCKKKKKMF